MRESEIEKHFVKRVKELGGIAYKFVSPGHRGVPDRLVLLPDGMVFFAELKAPGQKPEPHQEREHTRIRALGQYVLVLDSVEMVKEWLE